MSRAFAALRQDGLPRLISASQKRNLLESSQKQLESERPSIEQRIQEEKLLFGQLVTAQEAVAVSGFISFRLLSSAIRARFVAGGGGNGEARDHGGRRLKNPGRA